MTSDKATQVGREPGYDPDAPPCRHCGAHQTHWTDHHGDYDCHCEVCGSVFKSREGTGANQCIDCGEEIRDPDDGLSPARCVHCTFDRMEER